ncbi:MAG: threonylcarbamoyl-AMP synthase [Planctomycetes bacterium RBG_13_44_8b]|nr:MAG: threonylcarbamoyl-AMP synthase [Planctomycetes bacterium RBG_13_44_8b]
MQIKVVKLDAAKANIAKIKDAAAIVDAGGLVAFPTETVYGIACRVRQDSLKKLDTLKGNRQEKHYTLHISQTHDVVKYVPTIGIRAQKLIRSTWPGPLTIVFPLTEQDIEKQQKNLKREVFEGLYKNSSIGIRCPDNPIASILLRLTHHSVVAPSANITGQDPPTNPEQVLQHLSDKIDLLLDAGPCKFQKNSSVVKIDNKKLDVLRPGVYSQTELEELSSVKFLFVCTGNTCRSAMAEGICRHYLAEKLDCEVDDLEATGYKVSSAGIMDMDGAPASTEATAACEALGIDIKAHKSTALSQKIIQESDYIFAMEQVHYNYVTAMCPDAEGKCMLLAENQNITDPICQNQEVFNSCAALIENAIRNRIDGLIK